MYSLYYYNTHSLLLVPSQSQYPYDGILGSGTAVPTAFETAKPKKPKVLPAESDEVIKSLIEAATSGEKVLFILRGLPGSGKTTLAR